MLSTLVCSHTHDETNQTPANLLITRMINYRPNQTPRSPITIIIILFVF